MNQRAYVKGHNNSQSAQRHAPDLPPSAGFCLLCHLPQTEKKYRHKRGIETQSGQTPPGGYLNRSRVEMSGRQFAIIVKSKCFLEVAFAALAYSYHGVQLYEYHRFTPYFQTISCAAFFKSKHFKTARML